jgi:hypothetical protein
MSRIKEYDRKKAVSYARRWAFSRNPRYADFANMGGDCTNFASQCLYAGSGVMNFTPTFGWYYRNINDRSPSWTGVEYLYNFLTTNKTRAVFAREADIHEALPGDIIQLGTSELYYHNLVVVKADSPDNILISAHTFNADMRPLSSYTYSRIRFLHVLGVYV